MRSTDMDATTDMDGAWVLPQWAEPVRLVALQPKAPTETLTWRDAAEKPDCDITVLCWMADGEWYSGWWDDEWQRWMDCASAMPLEGVTHWAEPRGPGA